MSNNCYNGYMVNNNNITYHWIGHGGGETVSAGGRENGVGGQLMTDGVTGTLTDVVTLRV